MKTYTIEQIKKYLSSQDSLGDIMFNLSEESLDKANESNTYTVIDLKQTCYACPSQWEGTTSNNEDLYIRYRHGFFRVDINGETVFSKELSNQDDGVLDTEEMKELTTNLLVFD